MDRHGRDMAVKLLSSVGVWGILGAVFLPIYKEGSELWISVLMAVVAIAAIVSALKLVGMEYPEKPNKQSTGSDDGMNPVVMTGAAVVLADEGSTATDSNSSSESGSGSSSSFSSSSYDSGSSSNSD